MINYIQQPGWKVWNIILVNKQEFEMQLHLWSPHYYSLCVEVHICLDVLPLERIFFLIQGYSLTNKAVVISTTAEN